MYFRPRNGGMICFAALWQDCNHVKKLLILSFLHLRSLSFLTIEFLIFKFLNMPYLFTSESVSEGHPDKVADQISDALIDNFLAWDADSKVACETLVTTGLVVLAGEVKSNTYLDVQKIARDVISKIGYTKAEYMFEASSCGIISAIHEQSADINQGVDRKEKQEQGAGDQGMMFGYATSETSNYMPLALDLAHKILIELAALRRENSEISYLRPDAKSQVTIEYSDDHKPVRIDAIVVSTQHDDFAEEKAMREKISKDIISILIPRVKAQLKPELQGLFNNDIKYHINPTGKFVIGGPDGDAGLTGRKIIVDTYGGAAPHGGGAFSGKDTTKVDRSAAYAARYLAKNVVAAGFADRCTIQLSYAIGVAQPLSVYVDLHGTGSVNEDQVEAALRKVMDLSPSGIRKHLDLNKPIYARTSSYGHFGRTPDKDGGFS